MKKTDTIRYTLEQVDVVACKLKTLMAPCRVFTFTGSIGAGKTTLIRSMLMQCGVRGSISSPTFTYLNVYKNTEKEIFYHFDLYRINSVDEFVDAGFNEYVYVPDSWAFIEWPVPVAELLDHQVCTISIDYDGQDGRVLTYTVINSKKGVKMC